MIECRLAQWCEGEWQGTGATNLPGRLPLLHWNSLPLTIMGAESLAYLCSSMPFLGGVPHLSGVRHRRDFPVRFCTTSGSYGGGYLRGLYSASS